MAPVRRGSFKLGAAHSSIETIVSSSAVRGAHCQLSGLGHRKLERRGHTHCQWRGKDWERSIAAWAHCNSAVASCQLPPTPWKRTVLDNHFIRVGKRRDVLIFLPARRTSALPDVLISSLACRGSRFGTFTQVALRTAMLFFRAIRSRLQLDNHARVFAPNRWGSISFKWSPSVFYMLSAFPQNACKLSLCAFQLKQMNNSMNDANFICFTPGLPLRGPNIFSVLLIEFSHVVLLF